jgi:sugar transferase (PEP-CTERM/EpsH1 system associated)
MEALLFLAHRIPYPPTKGDKIRSYHILRHLSRSYRIHLGAFVDDPADWRHRSKLETICASVCLLPLRPLRAKLRSLTGLLSGSALSVPYFREQEMQRWVDSVMKAEDPRQVFVYSSPMAQYVMGEAPSPLKRVIDFVDVDSDKWRQYAHRKPWPLSWLYRREGNYLLNFEERVAQTFDASFFVSAAEANLFRRIAPESADRVRFMDNGVDHSYFSPERDYKNPYQEGVNVLVFTGAMDYWANIDAVRWFALDIFPQIRHSVPTAQFVIVGARPSREVLQLASLAGVTVTGPVADIRPYLAHARAAAAPLRIARGVQNKVLEAMAMAKPVLATPAAVEGIEFDNPQGLQISGDERQLATMAIHLLQSDSQGLVPDSRQWVCQRYDWDVNLGRLDELFESLSDQPEGAAQLQCS